MNAREAIRNANNNADFLFKSYLEDLTDGELLVRPVPGANHIAWQLGHLIASENMLVEVTCPGSMPPLPAGFKEKYSKETSTLDDPKAFHSKAELVRLHEEQRAAGLAALMKLTDADLDKPAPEAFRNYLSTTGDTFSLLGNHVLMHAGQWAVVRRKLGRPPLF